MLETYWADFFDLKDPLFKVRQRSWAQFEEIGLPKPKQEAFQYLRKKIDFPAPATKNSFQGEVQKGFVFVGGFFDEALSNIPEPLVCSSLTNAMRPFGLFLQSRIAKTLQEETDPFAALNGAFQGEGAFLYVPPKCKAALHLLQVFNSNEMASPRLHVYLGRDAELRLEQSSFKDRGLSNAVLDFVLDSGAKLSVIDSSDGDFQTIRASLKRDAKLKMVFLGKVFRNSLKVQLTEPNSEAEIFGLSRLIQEEEGHFHALIEHIAPHARSRQHFKSVLKDKARFSFEGKIYVHPEAQKTQSYQLNNNLILSDEASANAKPNLEIFADDVKASHGATVGRLDEEELFYLRSRGLGLDEASEWLIQGFCKEILDHAR